MQTGIISSSILGAIGGVAASQDLTGAIIGAGAFALGNKLREGSFSALKDNHIKINAFAAIGLGTIGYALSSSFLLNSIVANIGIRILLHEAFNVSVKFQDNTFKERFYKQHPSTLYRIAVNLFDAFIMFASATQVNKAVQSLIEGNLIKTTFAILSLPNPIPLHEDIKLLYGFSCALSGANAITNILVGNNIIATLMFGAAAIGGIRKFSLLPLVLFRKKDKAKNVDLYLSEGLSLTAIGYFGLLSVTNINPLLYTIPTILVTWAWAGRIIYRQGISKSLGEEIVSKSTVYGPLYVFKY